MARVYLRLLGNVNMVYGASSDTERKVISILKILGESSEPVGSTKIARQLEHHGIFLSERAVRYHLRIMDERAYTEPMGRDGRIITPKGLEELKMALAPEQVGFIVEKLELLAFKTTFDPKKRTGQLPINTSLFDKEQFPHALSVMRDVFKAGLCVSELVATAPEGATLGSVAVPSGKIGFATVCSAVINGVLLKSGVPMGSRFGGVLEIRDSKPRRFVALIDYAGTSLDPSEQYIRAGMTSVGDAARMGSGKILANFREMPAPAKSKAEDVIEALKEAGIGGVYAVGNISEPVCQISVGLNRVGIVLLGGLNPVAAAVEAGVSADNVGESGLMDVQQFVSVWQL